MTWGTQETENKKEFKYEITERLAILSNNGNFTKEANMISYNGAPEKLDIRSWNRETGRMGKGITLNREEAQHLLECLQNIFE